MLFQILLGCMMMIITTVIHTGGMVIGLWWLAHSHGSSGARYSIISRSLIVAVLVTVMFIATLIEAGVWALTYMFLGVISGFAEALYFSMVTYTTLGYGDVVLGPEWRLLSGFEAANGIIMFGWTTAIIIVALHHFVKRIFNLSP